MVAVAVSVGVTLVLFALTFLAPSRDVAYAAFTLGVTAIVISPLLHPIVLRNAPVVRVRRRWRVLADENSAQNVQAVAGAPNVTLVPSQGPGTQQRLAVTNNGPTAQFSVICRLVGRRNDPNPLRLGTFSLPWLHGFSTRREIQSGGTENVLIARVIVRDFLNYGGLEIRELVNGNQPLFESSRWDKQPGAALPEYDIEVRVLATGYQQPFLQTFTLRPENWTGGIRMEPR